MCRFYKEEIAGETKNYINSRAKYEGKLSLVTMRDVAVDCTEAYLRASDVLVGKGRYEQVWHEYVMGYVSMHLKNTRYLLADLGLDASLVNGSFPGDHTGISLLP